MQLTIAAIGSRGDVQPYLALALGLKAAGHTVTLIAGENFREFITRRGIELVPTVDIEAVMNTAEGREWVEAGNDPRVEIRQMRAITEAIAESATRALVETAPHSDVMLTGLAAEAFLQVVTQKFGTRVIGAALQPYQRSRSGAASLNIVTPGDNPLNWLMGTIVSRVLFGVYRPSLVRFAQQINTPAPTFANFMHMRRDTPYLYGVSGHVLPAPRDWGEHAHVTGYWFLDQPEYTPPDDLLDFLSAGDPPVYVGFGSMSNSNPQATFEMITRALEQSNQRAVIMTGWSGAKLDHTARTYVMDGVPHDWLFPRVAAIVHHGGAGTTAAALRSGTPSLIIPHMGDQPYWGRRVQALGVGAPPIPRHQLTAESLAAALKHLTTDAGIRDRAARLGEAIRTEDGISRAVELIEQYGKG